VGSYDISQTWQFGEAIRTIFSDQVTNSFTLLLLLYFCGFSEQESSSDIEYSSDEFSAMEDSSDDEHCKLVLSQFVLSFQSLHIHYKGTPLMMSNLMY